jgi:hypothetical protein
VVEFWDGHKMRPCEAGHAHGPKCHHVFKDGKWRLFDHEPREYARDRVSPKALTAASSGLYDCKGKLYYIPHTHGDRCAAIHKLDEKQGCYVYTD